MDFALQVRYGAWRPHEATPVHNIEVRSPPGWFNVPTTVIRTLGEYNIDPYAQSKTPKNGCTHQPVGATVFGCFALVL